MRKCDLGQAKNLAGESLFCLMLKDYDVTITK